MQEVWQALKNFGANFAQGAGIAIVRTAAFLVLGIIVVKIVTGIVRSVAYRSRRLDRAAASFVVSIVTIVLYVALVVVLVSSLGFSTAGIVAAFSAVALAVILALKDSLASLANGIIIIFTRPFSKGDYVEVNGTAGLVQDIRLFNTKILTYDNIEVIIPNSEILSTDMINYSAMPLRRAVVDVPLPYAVEPEAVRTILLECARGFDKVVNVPAPSVVLKEYGESSLTFSLRVWTQNEFYWDVLNGLYERIFAALRQNGIEIPFNQLEVRLLGESPAKKEEERK